MLHDPPRDVHPQWYEAPTFYFSNPHSLVGANDDVADSARLPRLRLRARGRRRHRPRRPRSLARGGRGAHRRLRNPERLVGARSPVRRDAGRPRAGEGQGLRDHARAVDRDPGRARAIPARRPPRPPDGGLGQRRAARRGHAREHGLVVRRASSPTPPRGAWVRTGDLLGSGTCGGGCLGELWGRAGRREPPPLAPGDVVTMTVEGLGTISNRVVPGHEPVPVPRARRRG